MLLSESIGDRLWFGAFNLMGPKVHPVPYIFASFFSFIPGLNHLSYKLFWPLT